MLRSSIGWVAVAVLAIAWVAAPLASGEQPTLEELKERVSKVSVPDRPPLCLHIAERQLIAAAKLYAAGEDEKAQEALADVAEFSKLDRDYAIKGHKHEKQSEIAIRKMVRKLNDMKHTVSHDEQVRLQTVVDQLERFRDDLLSAMFSQREKK